MCNGSRPQHGRHQFSLGPVCPLLTACCDLTIQFLSKSIINIQFNYSFVDIFFGKELVLSTQYCFCPILLNLYCRNIYVPTHPEFISCLNVIGISCACMFGETDICLISGRIRYLCPVCPLLKVCCDLSIPFLSQSIINIQLDYSFVEIFWQRTGAVNSVLLLSYRPQSILLHYICTHSL